MQNKSVHKNKIFYFLAATILIIALPIILILVRHQQDNRSHAAAADKLEAEGGILGGNAKSQSDSNASGGQYVAFLNSNSTPIPTPPTTSASYEGFGSTTSGGAAYGIVNVTNLNDSGPGSLREALSTGNRRVHFTVGGTITALTKIYVQGSNITLDGATAPAPGITIIGRSIIVSGAYNNLIFKDFRHRGGSLEQVNDGDNITLINGPINNVVIDHVSLSGNHDESLGIWRDVHNVTVSNSIFGPGEVNNHNFALLVGQLSTHISIHHNLFSGLEYRQPAVGYDDTLAQTTTATIGDVVNNVIWNYRDYGTSIYWGGKANVISNYYYSSTYPGANRAIAIGGGSSDTAKAYLSGNYSKDGSPVTGLSNQVNAPFTVDSASKITTTSDARANAAVVKSKVGCRVGGLDAYDTALLSNISL